MIFGAFCKIFVFYRKKKNERKRKNASMGLVQPTTKPSVSVEKKSHEERPIRSWTFYIRNPNLFKNH
jgi:hypothetical protein